MTPMVGWVSKHRGLSGWVAGLATCGLVAVSIAGWAILGGFDTSANVPHIPAIGWLAHTAMKHSVAIQAKDVEAPARFTPEQVEAGGRLYMQNCVQCHGGPGVARVGWVSGLIPSPPYLVDASETWSRAELYAIIKDGVKMTAMPSWGETKSDAEIWSLAAFVEAMPSYDPRQFQALARQNGQPASAAP